MSQILKKLIAAERKRRLDGKAAEFYKSNAGPTNVPGSDYIKFAEQYMMTSDGKPMKFSETDRYLFEQIELAAKNGWQLMDIKSRQRPQVRVPRDGEEVHTITHEPWEEPFLAQHAVDSGRAFKVTLDRKFYPPPTVEFGKLQIPRSEVKFDRQEGNQIFLSFPYNGEQVTISFLEQSVLWDIFPEIAKQLGKI